jgi:hypothetical protein
MAQGKYAKYVIELGKPDGYCPQHIGKIANPFTFSQENFAESPIHVECHMHYAPGGRFGGGDTLKAAKPGVNLPTTVLGVHKHPVDEAFFFFGTNPQDTSELGGEIEFWLGEGDEAEKIIINKPTCVYVPKNLAHNPNVARKVDRPFFMVAILLAPEWCGDYKDLSFPPGYKP